MRKLLIGLMVGVAVVLSACGSASSLSKQEQAAVRAVEKNIDALGAAQSYTSQEVVGVITKDSKGNKITLVYVQVTDPSQPKASQKWSLLVIIVENPKGQLVFADADLPSGIVTVLGPGAK